MLSPLTFDVVERVYVAIADVVPTLVCCSHGFRFVLAIAASVGDMMGASLPLVMKSS